jgi:site-specific DNA recombinase
MTKSKVRCAIYTRKSSEEGLEQEFNSLEAQRGACEAYIKSQAHEGWRAIPERFDDGGHSGGTLERPALQQLLAAVRERRVDVIVIYKIDRLTRSLMDFAKLAELFEKEGISFVSVTQQFNTTTSMGRLMLNVLLSFAQFEREITGERIRDKIAASKKKGMWMGGTPPIGYRVENRTLVVEPEDAETVRAIFRLYLETRNVRALADTLNERGIRTKGRVHPNGTATGGQRFQRGHLYGLLSNPLYIGRIGHKGQSYPGTHPPIIDQKTWDAVQSQLAHNTQGPRKRAWASAAAPSRLAGRLYADNGNRFTSSHANKAGRRYRYYVEQLPGDSSNTKRRPWRIPAQEIEGAVKNVINGFLNSKQRLLEALDPLSAAEAQQVLHAIRQRHVAVAKNSATSRDETIDSMINKVVLSRDHVRVWLDRSKLSEALGLKVEDGRREPSEQMALELTVPIRIKTRGTQTKFTIGTAPVNPNQDLALIKALARAYDWLSRLKSGEADSIDAIARSERLTGSYVTRLLRLAFLAPDLVERILNGAQPSEASIQLFALRKEIPLCWQEQVRALRCAVPDSDGASSILSRQEEDVLWQAFFTAAPARRRVFEPSSKHRKRAPGPLPPDMA